MTRRSLPFNWYLIDRKSLINVLWSIANSVVDKSLSITDFHQSIYRQIKKFLPVRVSKKLDLKIDPQLVYMGGMYHSYYDQMAWKSIEVVFEYHSKDSMLTMTADRFYKICQCFADTVLHEMMHMRQYRRRSFKCPLGYDKGTDEQRYLGHVDEIDAYSFNIACELMDEYRNNQKQVIAYLNSKSSEQKNNSWCVYLDTFNHNHNHEIIKRVKQRVIRYLPYAELGKPFKTKTWLTY